jgi:ring-1,2-phenylacetyl-CoA epoxidase subunit PaaB
MALLNARDVFVRRPACFSLWIVPANMIFSMTAEELTLRPNWFSEIPKGSRDEDDFHLFEKRTHKGLNAHIGDIKASSPEEAMKIALETVANRSALVWWIFPASSVTRSTPEDIEALFAPSATKDYRDQSFFHTEAIMQKLKSRS